MIYTIHMNQSGRSRPAAGTEDGRFDDVVAIPDGLASWALIFPPFWLAFHKLWFALVIYMLVAALSLALLATPYAIVSLMLGGIPALYLLLEGHQLRRARIEAEGLKLAGVVDASSERMAISRFLTNWQEPSEPTVRRSPVMQPKHSAATFGMFPGLEH